MITKEEWYSRLKRFVPSWVTQEENTIAVLMGFAAVLEQLSVSVEDHISETYISSAVSQFLLEHGTERSILRSDSDTDLIYRARVRNIINSSNLPSLKEFVDALLIVGESTFIEHFSTESFLDAGAFADRNIIDTGRYDYNAFTVTVPFQIPPAITFFGDNFFADRLSVLGANESSIELFENIVSVLNSNKAFGTIYRLMERST